MNNFNDLEVTFDCCNDSDAAIETFDYNFESVLDDQYLFFNCYKIDKWNLKDLEWQGVTKDHIQRMMESYSSEVEFFDFMMSHYTPKNFKVSEIQGNYEDESQKVIHLISDVVISDDELKNLLFDEPIFAVVGINEDTIYLNEFIDDLYNVNKADILAACEKALKDYEYKDYVIKYLKNDIPDYFEYK